MSDEAQVPRHHTQLPVLLLQASGVGKRMQGSVGRERVKSLPRVTPLKPPDRNRRPPQPVIAKETERFTGSPTEDTRETRQENALKKGAKPSHTI